MTSLPAPLVLATRNVDKAREIVEILVGRAGLPIVAYAVDVGDTTIAFLLEHPDRIADAVAALPALAAEPDVEETGATLEENARIKASAVATAIGLPAIADDTGLEVDALDGAPGVYAARYAGPDATYADNVRKLLRELEGVYPALRTARFATVAIACWPDGREIAVRGEVEGVISAAEVGESGFGYDPVFVPTEGDGRSFAQMTAAEKHAISHRGRAFARLAEAISARRGPRRGMPLHPAAQQMLDAMLAAGLAFQPGTTPEQRRAAMNAVIVDGSRIEPVHAVEDHVVPASGVAIPIRVFKPSVATGLPALVWFHGGGWVTGSIETHDLLCRQLCNAVDATVVSVGYRLAPETTFPGAVNDCVAAWHWITARPSHLDLDPTRIAVGGDSAGGNLAAVLAITARDAGLPAPAHQLLVYPVTDHEFESPAMIANARGYFLEADTMRWFYGHYARTHADYDDWRMSPLRTPDLAGVAAATVLTAEYDPLRDQGEAYARRLRDAGVPTELLRADGLFHGYFGMQKFMPPAKEPWDVAVRALRASLGTA